MQGIVALCIAIWLENTHDAETVPDAVLPKSGWGSPDEEEYAIYRETETSQPCWNSAYDKILAGIPACAVSSFKALYWPSS